MSLWVCTQCENCSSFNDLKSPSPLASMHQSFGYFWISQEPGGGVRACWDGNGGAAHSQPQNQFIQCTVSLEKWVMGKCGSEEM